MFDALANAVDDIWFSDLYNEYNHVAHFPHYCTYSVDTVPIAVCGGQSKPVPNRSRGF